MSLADRLPSAPIPKGPQCSACRLLAQHPGDEDTIQQWRMAGHHWRSIAEAVTAEHGVEINGPTLSRHVRGLCLGRRVAR
ncbi:MAG: hypothetical protein NVSMB4_08740 [Acidimicrobiales bacterium]